MRSRPWAKYVAGLLMVALVVPGTLLLANAIQDKKARDEAVDAAKEEACAGVTDRLVGALDGFSAQFEGVTALTSEKIPPMPSMDQLREEAGGLEEQIGVADCDKADVEAAVLAWRDDAATLGPLGDGVRGALAANVLDVLAGGSTPVRRVLEAGEDVATVVGQLPDGATLVLPEGRFEPEQPVVVVQDLTIEGAGSDASTVASSAEGAAFILASPVAWEMSGVAVTHTGGGTASVVVLRAGTARLEDVRLSGATGGTESPASAEGGVLAGGSGLVLAGAEGADLVDLVVEDNEVGGLVVAGGATPGLSSSIVRDNAVCGLCFLGRSGGTVRGTRISGNGVGVMVGDRAVPLLERNRLEDNEQAGLLVERFARPVVRRNTVTRNGRIGVAVYGSSSPRLVGNTVSGHTQAGVLVNVAAKARPRVDGSVLSDNGQAALVFMGRSRGGARGNTCSGSRFALVVDGAADPELSGNRCTIHVQRG